MPYSVKTGPPVPFPSDIAVAPIERISLSKLEAQDFSEVERMFNACKKRPNCFHLDLQGTLLGSTLLDDADALIEMGKELFALDYEEKAKYNIYHDRNSDIG